MLIRQMIAGFCIAVCLTGCCRKSTHNACVSLPSLSVAFELGKYNVALCPGTSCIAVSANDGTNRFFALTSTLPTTSVVAFYRREMEIRGWQIDDLSVDETSMLVCQAGARLCVIMVEKNTVTSCSIKLFIKSLSCR